MAVKTCRDNRFESPAGIKQQLLYSSDSSEDEDDDNGIPVEELLNATSLENMTMDDFTE